MSTFFLHRPGMPALPVEIETRQRGNRGYLIFGQMALSAPLDAWHGLISPEAPGVLRDEPPQVERFNLITITDLTGEPAHDWPLIAARFPWLADTIPANYQRLPIEIAPQTNPDVQALAPYAAELIGDDGQPVYGAQSRVAELLNLPSTGGSYRKRILDALEILQEAA